MKKQASKLRASTPITTTLLLTFATLGGISLCLVTWPILLKVDTLEPLALLQCLVMLVAFYFIFTSWVLFFREKVLHPLTNITLCFFAASFAIYAFALFNGFVANAQHHACYAFMGLTPISCITSHTGLLTLLYYWTAPVIAIVYLGLCITALVISLKSNDSQTEKPRKRS